jgi:NarL family two-component system response regulator LiaR
MTGKTKDKIHVLIVDDHQMVREGLKIFLEIQEDIQIVGEAGDGENAFRQAQKLQPDVVLMDLVLPKVDGITAIKKIHEDHPGIRIIALTSFSENDKVFPAIRAGAVGYLLKDVSPAELVETIRAAFRGEKRLHPKITEKLVENISLERKQRTPDELTERELEVLGCIAKGLSNQKIGDTLFISEKTVKTHVSNILSKLQIEDRTQAAIYAIKKGLT